MDVSVTPDENPRDEARNVAVEPARTAPKPLPFVARLMFVAFAVFSRLPLRVLHFIGSIGGPIVARVWPPLGPHLREHLRGAYPEAGFSMVREAERNMGRMMMELPFFLMRDNTAYIDRHVEMTEWRTLDDLHAQGRGLILVTAHSGCFELLSQLVALRRPIAVLYRPPRQWWSHEWIARVRARPDLTPVPANVRGVRTLVRTLREGGTIGVLPDQVPRIGEGVWAPFFGRPAYTMTLVHRLHKHHGSPVAGIVAERLPRSAGYRVHVRVPHLPLPDDPVEAATEVNRLVETLIDAAPAQYLWSYDRYRRPR